jgi:hypothetical protein
MFDVGSLLFNVDGSKMLVAGYKTVYSSTAASLSAYSASNLAVF